MNLLEVTEKIALKQVTDLEISDKTIITGGYVSDLLSNVMGQSTEGHIWITMQGHPNITAVASLLNLACIIVAGGSAVEAATIAKANDNNVIIFTSDESSFELTGKLYALGVKG